MWTQTIWSRIWRKVLFIYSRQWCSARHTQTCLDMIRSNATLVWYNFKNERKKIWINFCTTWRNRNRGAGTRRKQADGYYDAFIALEIHSADNAFFFSFFFIFCSSHFGEGWSLNVAIYIQWYMTYDMRHFQFLFPVGGLQKPEFLNFCRRQSVVCIIYFFYRQQIKRNWTEIESDGNG